MILLRNIFGLSLYFLGNVACLKKFSYTDILDNLLYIEKIKRLIKKQNIINIINFFNKNCSKVLDLNQKL